MKPISSISNRPISERNSITWNTASSRVASRPAIAITSISVSQPAIHAAATLTLALPKAGLLSEGGRAAVGELYLGDISVPPQLYEALGLDVPPLFATSLIMPVHVENGRAFLLPSHEPEHVQETRLKLRDWE